MVTSCETRPETQLLAALRFLAGQDPDRAQSRNGVGFNASDSGLGHRLDGRMSTKNYGGIILASLPPASRTRSLDSVRTFFDTGANLGSRQDRLF